MEGQGYEGKSLEVWMAKAYTLSGILASGIGGWTLFQAGMV